MFSYGGKAGPFLFRPQEAGPWMAAYKSNLAGRALEVRVKKEHLEIIQTKTNKLFNRQGTENNSAVWFQTEEKNIHLNKNNVIISLYLIKNIMLK